MSKIILFGKLFSLAYFVAQLTMMKKMVLPEKNFLIVHVNNFMTALVINEARNNDEDWNKFSVWTLDTNDNGDGDDDTT